jgi:serine/threonine protein kinase
LNISLAVMKPQHHNAESRQPCEDQLIQYLPESDSRARSADVSTSINVDEDLTQLGDLIGTGMWSKSSTYIALNKNTGELFAVKQVDYSKIEAQNAPDDNKIQRMRRDLVYRLIDIVSRLDHPNIVRYIGDQLEKNIHSISMEYVFGRTLRDFVATYGKLSMPMVSRFSYQILLGLAYLHRESIVHRDLTVDKILLSSDCTCKIRWSFKMAKVEDAHTTGADDAIEGTRYLLAPEVVRSQGSGYTAKAVSQDLIYQRQL